MKLVKIRRDIPNSYGGTLPARMAYLEEKAASSFLSFSSRVVVSDVYRSPESSLLAVKTRRGALPPGRSAHNYGLAIDLDLKQMGVTSTKAKRELDMAMANHGWYCHRTDGLLRHEAWHYNYLREDLLGPGEKNRGAAVDRLIRSMASFSLDTKHLQAFLKSFAFYSGEVDGDYGPLTKQAVAAFRRAWVLGPGGNDEALQRIVYVIELRAGVK